jgi:hypothetical protein
MRQTLVRPDAFQELGLSPVTQFDWARGRVVVFGRGEAVARYVAVDLSRHMPGSSWATDSVETGRADRGQMRSSKRRLM